MGVACGDVGGSTVPIFLCADTGSVKECCFTYL